MASSRTKKAFQELKDDGFNTCIDTNGNVFNDDVKNLLKNTDLVLLDIKHINADWHKTITGKTNETTLKFAEYLREKNVNVWMRYVLVPGYSDQPEYLHEMGKHFQEYSNIEKLEIQPYHKLGIHKYEHLNMEYKLNEVPENTLDQLQTAKDIFSQYFKEVIIN
ncbi:radical SAM protein [Labilibaculum sp. DW002]|uniref:Radical SAM protein n=1 Tax=Paralabilibaculum antarcticum TaxID=2912572 RepID=A0ABT5VMY7_9BACT|nr:radical SAM protein [Labilibaculum sp. DW002]